MKINLYLKILYIKKYCSSFFYTKLESSDIKLFYILILLSLLYVFPIILSNVLYIDDLGRSLWGHTWYDVGRPVASWMLELISQSTRLVDSAPLPLLVALIIYCFFVIQFMKKFDIYNNAKISEKLILALVPLLNPYFLENLSYHFEVVFNLMSLGGTLYVFSRRQKAIIDIIISVLLLYAFIAVYQVSIVIFFELIIFEITVSIIVLEHFINIIKKTIIRLCCLCFGAGLYYLTVPKIWPLSNGAKMRGELITDSFGDFVTKFYENLCGFKQLYIDLYYSFKYLIIVLFILYAIAILCFVFRNLTSIYENFWIKVLRLIWLLFVHVFSLMAVVVPYCLAKYPEFVPRVFVPLSIALLIFCYVIIYILRRYSLPFLAFFIFSFYNCSFAYGQTLYHEFDHQKYIASMIARDVKSYAPNIKNMDIVNRVNASEWLKSSSIRYPIFNSLVPIYMNYNWMWGYVLLKHYDLTVNYKQINEQYLIDKKVKPVLDNGFYTMYLINDVVVIKFEKN